MSKKSTKKLTQARKAEKTTLASRLASLGATQGQSPPAATNDDRPWDEVSPGEAGFGEIDLDGIDIDALIEKTLAGWDRDQDLGDGAADGEILEFVQSAPDGQPLPSGHVHGRGHGLGGAADGEILQFVQSAPDGQPLPFSHDDGQDDGHDDGQDDDGEDDWETFESDITLPDGLTEALERAGAAAPSDHDGAENGNPNHKGIDYLKYLQLLEDGDGDNDDDDDDYGDDFGDDYEDLEYMAFPNDPDDGDYWIKEDDDDDATDAEAAGDAADAAGPIVVTDGDDDPADQGLETAALEPLAEKPFAEERAADTPAADTPAAEETATAEPTPAEPALKEPTPEMAETKKGRAGGRGKGKGKK